MLIGMHWGWVPRWLAQYTAPFYLFFLTSLPLFGINIINNLFFEIGMIGLALAIGSFSLWHGYRKHHHSLLPLGLFFAGFHIPGYKAILYPV
jgi:hypothetical protein